MRVLVVEDEPDVSAVFRDFLLELGHEPVLVRSAEAALSALEQEPPDAIILDINLPGLSGLDFLQLKPVRDAGLPIVAVSGVASENQARECLRLGAFDFMGKPVAFDRLGEVLAHVEPLAVQRHLGTAAEIAERRRAGRVQVIFPVRIVDYHGGEWEGWAADLTQFGIRVTSEATLRQGSMVRLTFTPPDGRGLVRVTALVVRSEGTTHAFYFVNLTAEDFQRLGDFIRTH